MLCMYVRVRVRRVVCGCLLAGLTCSKSSASPVGWLAGGCMETDDRHWIEGNEMTYTWRSWSLAGANTCGTNGISRTAKTEKADM